MVSLFLRVQTLHTFEHWQQVESYFVYHSLTRTTYIILGLASKCLLYMFFFYKFNVIIYQFGKTHVGHVKLLNENSRGPVVA